LKRDRQYTVVAALLLWSSPFHNLGNLVILLDEDWHLRFGGQTFNPLFEVNKGRLVVLERLADLKGRNALGKGRILIPVNPAKAEKGGSSVRGGRRGSDDSSRGDGRDRDSSSSRGVGGLDVLNVLGYLQCCSLLLLCSSNSPLLLLRATSTAGLGETKKTKTKTKKAGQIQGNAWQ